MHLSRWAAVAAFTFLLLFADGLWAQATKDVPRSQAYEGLVDRGVQEAALGNYLEARSLFLEAHKIFPNARTLRALGMVEFELKNYVMALAYLEQALHSSVKPLDPEKRAQVERLRTDARSFVARYTLEVHPRDAAVMVDDTPASESSILLQVGDHTLQVSSAGYHTQRRTLHVRGGDAQTVTVSLVAVSGVEEAPAIQLGTAPTSSSSESTARRLRQRRWWIAGGIVLAAAAVAVGIAVPLARRDDEPAAPAPNTGLTLEGFRRPQ